MAKCQSLQGNQKESKCECHYQQVIRFKSRHAESTLWTFLAGSRVHKYLCRTDIEQLAKENCCKLLMYQLVTPVNCQVMGCYITPLRDASLLHTTRSAASCCSTSTLWFFGLRLKLDRFGNILDQKCSPRPYLKEPRYPWCTLYPKVKTNLSNVFLEHEGP